MSQFTYTIKEFNKELKSIIVGFEGGSWARIDLKTPLPTTKEELEVIIKQFTAPQEVIDARADTSIDLSFIEPLVGQENTADRFSYTALTAPKNPPPVISDEDKAKEAEYFKLTNQKSLGDNLIAFGLMTENPITQEMIDATKPSYMP